MGAGQALLSTALLSLPVLQLRFSKCLWFARCVTYITAT